MRIWAELGSKDNGCGLNSNPIDVTEGEKVRALIAKEERNADLAESSQNTSKLGEIFNNSLGPSGTQGEKLLFFNGIWKIYPYATFPCVKVVKRILQCADSFHPSGCI